MSARKENEKDLCSICRETVGNNDHAIECEGCNRWQHLDCCGLTKGELDIAKRKTCKLTWLCAECKPKALQKLSTEDTIKIDILTAKVQELLDYIQNNLQKQIRQEITSAISEEMDKMQTRPTVIKKPKSKAPKPPVLQEDNELQPSNSQVPEGESTEHQEIQSHPEEEDAIEEINGQESEQENEGENEWMVQRRRRRIIVGTRNEGTNRIRAGERRAWLYIGRLHSTTTPEDIKSYLSENGISEHIDCEQLNNIGGR